MAFTEFRPLEEKSLIEYIKTVPALHSKLGKNLDDIKVKEVGDGNLNFVYIIVGPDGSFVIKQVFFLRVYILFFMLCVFIDFLGILHFIGWVREHELKKEKKLGNGFVRMNSFVKKNQKKL